MTGVVSPVLVGRESELAGLRSAVERARDGQAGVVLISGEAGVGKTRLLDGALDPDALPPGTQVLSGGCVEFGGEDLPFVPFVEALRALVRVTEPGELDELLGPARAELARLLPELATDDVPVSGRTTQLFELVLAVLTRIGQRRPLVLVFEDLHWADRSTLELAAFLVRQLQGTRVVLVLTYRSDEVDRYSPLRPLLSGWERLRGVERVRLERFSQTEVGAQIAGILGQAPDAELLDTVFARSEGNAFLVEEVLRTVRDGGSADEMTMSLRELLLTRTERLSEPARRLLRVAAVAGRTVPEALLARVATDSGAPLFDALRELVDASLLVVDATGNGYAFRHALTRDAVYQDLLPGERVQLHTAYARELDEDPVLAGAASAAATLAVHWYAAHDLPRALAAAVRAGDEAMASYAPAEARRHFERALEVWWSVPDAELRTGVDHVEVLCLAARAAATSGDNDRALSLYGQALAQLGPDTDPERTALITERQAFALRMKGEDGAGVAVLEQALKGLPDRASTARATVLATLAGSLMRLGEERAADTARDALAAARECGSFAQEASALVTLGASIGYVEDGDEGELALREGLRIAEEIRDDDEALRAYANLSDLLEARGRHREAADAARAGLELSDRVGRRRSIGAFLVGNLVEPLLRLGEWDEAERLAREALATSSGGSTGASLNDHLGYQAVHRGRYTEARDLVRQAREMLGASREPQFIQSLAYTEAEAARGEGDLESAAAATSAGLEHLTATWAVRYAWPLIWLGRRIEADRAVYARDRGQPEPTPFLDHVRPPESGSLRASAAYRIMADAEGRRRDGDTASVAWTAAERAWQEAGDAWPLAYARLRRSEALAAEGAARHAGESLRAALHSADALHAQPLIDEIRALARRARIPLDTEATVTTATGPAPEPAPFGLTDRERAVLALVADGLSNSQIAKSLFISPKTASVHVSNILAKLGVSGRVEAAAVAHRLGLVTPDERSRADRSERR